MSNQDYWINKLSYLIPFSYYPFLKQQKTRQRQVCKHYNIPDYLIDRFARMKAMNILDSSGVSGLPSMEKANFSNSS